MGPALLTQEQAAELLQVSPRTLAGWRCRGGGPRFLKLGSTGKTSPIRYRASAIERYMNERERLSTSDLGPDARESGAK